MAGSIMVRYAKKTSKQLNKERSGSHAQMKQLNYSVDIDPSSISIMTFEDMKEANAFASRMRDDGMHIIEIKDDYWRN
tara:strand:+ start:666 stop:899 length:234 start_codon:yes stop_codon:yes gene_type:complete